MIIAKFIVAQVSHFNGGGSQVIMTPVIPAFGDKESENAKFWKATPAGKLELYIDTPMATESFQVGQEMYLDFTTAEPKPQ